jgi:hypothetical protein
MGDEMKINWQCSSSSQRSHYTISSQIRPRYFRTLTPSPDYKFQNCLDTGYSRLYRNVRNPATGPYYPLGTVPRAYDILGPTNEWKEEKLK